MTLSTGTAPSAVEPPRAPRLGPLPEGVDPADLPWDLGTLEPELLAALNLCLDSAAPATLVWGERRLLVYNQAYVPLTGSRHPGLFGASLPEAWPPAWAAIGSQLDSVFETGKAREIVDQPGMFRTAEGLRDCHLTYDLTPVRASDGTVSGIFIPIVETTREVLGRRRLATLHGLAAEATADRSPEELCTRMAEVLAANPDDVPFSLVYLLRPAQRSATLQASTGPVQAADGAPADLHLDGRSGWPVAEAIGSATPVLVDDVEQRFPDLLAGVPTGTPRRALISHVDLGHERLPNVIVILGVGNRQALDADYQVFLHAVMSHVHVGLNSVARARREREQNTNLQRAMTTNRQIGAAIGILMTVHKVTEQQAFGLLSTVSQRSNTKLRDLADEVVTAGMLPTRTGGGKGPKP